MLSLQENVVRTFRNVREMLQYRGIDTSALECLSDNEVEALATSQNVFTVEVNPELFVVFYLTKMKVSEFNTALFGKQKDLSPDIATQNANKKFIFVFKDDPNNLNRNHINEYFPKNEIFNMKSMLIQPHLHSYVPRHRKLDDNEAKEVLKRHQIENKSHLPSILSSDTMAKFIGLVPGDIVEITRSSPTAGMYMYYRLCT